MSRFEVVFRKQNYKKSAIKQLYTPDYLPSINDLLYPISSYLVWFGLYICPAKPKPIYGLGKKKGSPLLFSFDSSLSIWIRKLVDFQFLGYGLSTEFEHKSVNTEGCDWWLKRVGAELCSDLCSK